MPKMLQMTEKEMTRQQKLLLMVVKMERLKIFREKGSVLTAKRVKEKQTQINKIFGKEKETLGNYTPQKQAFDKKQVRRGKHENRNCIPKGLIKDVKEHIKWFPVSETHYARGDNPHKRNLNPSLVWLKCTISTKKNVCLKISNLWGEHIYRKVFKNDFNLSFRTPRKDTCSFCDKLHFKIQAASNEEEKRILKTEHELHLRKAEAARNAMSTDTECSNDPDSKVDTCGGQNRNINIALTLTKVTQDPEPSFNTFDLKFLLPGHSYLPNDKDFGLIEKKLNKKSFLSSPVDICEVIRNAGRKNKFISTEMKHCDFLSLKGLQNAVRQKPYKILYKEKVNEKIDFYVLILAPKHGRGRHQEYGTIEISLLYPHARKMHVQKKQGENGAAPEYKGGENGISSRQPAHQRHRPARFPLAKIREWAGRFALMGGEQANRSLKAGDHLNVAISNLTCSHYALPPPPPPGSFGADPRYNLGENVETHQGHARQTTSNQQSPGRPPLATFKLPGGCGGAAALAQTHVRGRESPRESDKNRQRSRNSTSSGPTCAAATRQLPSLLRALRLQLYLTLSIVHSVSSSGPTCAAATRQLPSLLRALRLQLYLTLSIVHSVFFLRPDLRCRHSPATITSPRAPPSAILDTVYSPFCFFLRPDLRCRHSPATITSPRAPPSAILDTVYSPFCFFLRPDLRCRHSPATITSPRAPPSAILDTVYSPFCFFLRPDLRCRHSPATNTSPRAPPSAILDTVSTVFWTYVPVQALPTAVIPADKPRGTLKSSHLLPLQATASQYTNGRLHHRGSRSRPEIGSKINTENCCAIRVQSLTGDRDEVHFEPPKLAVRNLDPKSAAIVDKWDTEEKAGNMREQRRIISTNSYENINPFDKFRTAKINKFSNCKMSTKQQIYMVLRGKSDTTTAYFLKVSLPHAGVLPTSPRKNNSAITTKNMQQWGKKRRELEAACPALSLSLLGTLEPAQCCQHFAEFGYMLPNFRRVANLAFVRLATLSRRGVPARADFIMVHSTRRLAIVITEQERGSSALKSRRAEVANLRRRQATTSKSNFRLASGLLHD
ncbi:hypothetical protein PR048_025895 [Dryococelus australis]|uniref:Uncharacterized protein n=1 Tax=Dryococelus australis TaxID=614101 RepID=A0ABQ9GJV5_9NEOP|nr:hypothetical protein PR048_025895 [Dryococelus australis]